MVELGGEEYVLMQTAGTISVRAYGVKGAAPATRTCEPGRVCILNCEFRISDRTFVNFGTLLKGFDTVMVLLDTAKRLKAPSAARHRPKPD